VTALNLAAYQLHLAAKRRGGLLQWGSRNATAVKAVQERLTSLGYATEGDGQWGKETEASFRAFQHASGLKVDGKLGPKSLDQLLKSKPKDGNAADPGLDAVTRVVSPEAAKAARATQTARRTSALGEIKAQQHGGGAAATGGRGSGSGGSRAAGATKAPPKGPNGGRIDPVTGAEVATATTGPIGSTDPNKANTPHQPQDNNPEFNKLHPREGGKFAAKGSEGQDVQNAQTALNKVNPDAMQLKADGVFGDKTDARVKAYQKNNNLKVDGIVGPKTSASLRRQLAASKQPVAKPPARRN
jgi:peptidoglycan hydrolase-like protein with peptidoglycan-binding domain